MNETDLANGYYASINFHDGRIDEKMYDAVSSSFLQRTLENPIDQNTNEDFA